MADRARLTVADHALIHLTGYLCLTAGERAADIAEDIGLSLGDLSARFRAICPEPGIEAQRRLIEVLRARTGSHRTEAAE